MKEKYPAVSFTRGPLDDGAEYFGPYYNGWAIKKAMKYLRKVFPYSTHELMPKRVCLQYHIGLCPGVEEAKITEKEYKGQLKKLILYLKGKRKEVVKQIEKEMKAFAKASEFEKAAIARNQLNDLKSLQRQIVFSDREFMDLSKDQALAGLKNLLGLKDIPKRIEGYDISHMSGTNNVASMVVATGGLADKASYRKFKMRTPGNNDFAHMSETMGRRFSGRHKDWPQPDLILIDGGKGQLSSALEAMEELGISLPTIGLAKREEQIVVHKNRSNLIVDVDAIKAWAKEENPFNEPSVYEARSKTLETSSVSKYVKDGYRPGYMQDSEDFLIINLPKNSHIVKLLQRIRDESHRFAVSYHTHLKRTGQTRSVLDDIPGVGPTTRRKLLKAFGSVSVLQQAQTAEIAKHVGLIKAKTIKAHLK